VRELSARAAGANCPVDAQTANAAQQAFAAAERGQRQQMTLQALEAWRRQMQQALALFLQGPSEPPPPRRAPVDQPGPSRGPVSERGPGGPYVPEGQGSPCPQLAQQVRAACERITNAICQRHMDCPGCGCAQDQLEADFGNLTAFCLLHPAYLPAAQGAIAAWLSESEGCASAFVAANDFGRVGRGRQCTGDACQRREQQLTAAIAQACQARCAEDGRRGVIKVQPHRCECE